MLSTLAYSLLAGLASAAATPQPLRAEPPVQARSVCSGNTATTRTEWCDYSIDTDYTSVAVDTGVTREYWFNLENTYASPDGYNRSVMAINGSVPGPTIIADWGDTVVVHVTNNLESSIKNGTSIHWHGIRQNYTNDQDGVSSITQCPLAPGSSMTYTWKAEQYGTSWYHSHFGIQAWEGVFGGIIINGPASANYDEDLGHLFLNDWSHVTVDELYTAAQTSGPPTMLTGLINGTNVYGDDGSSDQTGQRLNVSFTSGQSYRLRIVDSSIDTHWKFSIDNHTMTVIAADLVPIEPFTTNVLNLGCGQRYDVIVTADQADVADNFWMRAIPQSACSDNDNADNIRAVVYYGDSPSTPTTTGYDYTDGCDDETSNLVPAVSKDVSDADWDDLSSASVSKNTAGLFRWYLNSTTMLLDWEDPTLLQVVNGSTDWSTEEAVIELDEADQWIYFVIQTTMTVPHPIHLHGHDFFIIAQGSGTYSSDISLNTTNPARRDTAMLPSQGYLVIAFETDNPGAWIMHCHIGWHTAEGFAVQFLERQTEIADLIDTTAIEDTCSSWTTYATEVGIDQEDSGV